MLFRSHSALLRGQEVEHVAIIGAGLIDGNCAKRKGPKPIAFKNCRHVAVRDITLQNAPNYNISLLGCEHVNIEGVTILNGYAAYRTQIFCYLKACGRTELGTMNLWAGIDPPPAQ